jgi:zona occludens toxin (predicted ATPase)
MSFHLFGLSRLMITFSAWILAFLKIILNPPAATVADETGNTAASGASSPSAAGASSASSFHLLRTG